MIVNSLRGRIALAAAMATAVVILLGGALVTLFITEAERDGLDERLASQVDAVAPKVDEAIQTGESLAPILTGDERTDVGTSIRVFNGAQEIGSVGENETVLPTPSVEGYQTIRIGTQSWRVYVEGVDIDGDRYLIETSTTTTVTEQLISEVRGRVLYVALVCAILSGFSGWAFGGVATRPLAHLRAAAERVSRSRDLSVRAPTDLGPAEVDDVAKSLNVMLARLEEASTATEQALASSRAFAGNAAHEMRTPLTSMRANLDILSRNLDLPAGQREEIVNSVISEQERLGRLLDALHTLARGDVIGDAQLDIIDIADLVGVAIESISRRFPDVTFAYDVPAEAETEIRGWSDGLRVMIDNLLINAARHGGAQVRITVDNDEGEGVLLSVEDDGVGIPEDERKDVFTRFYRGRNVKAAGSGLGLALVAQQSRIHSGDVVIDESSLGGARFRVRLIKA